MKTVRGKRWGVPRGNQYVRGWVTRYCPELEERREEQERPDIACLFYGDLDNETPEQFILRQEEATLLLRAVDKLPVREACVLRCRYGFDCEPMTLDQVGEMLGVQKERIRQIQAAAERKLRRRLKTDFSNRDLACSKRFDSKPKRTPLEEAKVWWQERTQEKQLELARQEAEAARQAVQEAEREREAKRQVALVKPAYPQFARPSCDDPVNRYCNFYKPRVTNAATGEWEWMKYDPRAA